MKCGLNSYDVAELFNPYCYRINENYRNAKEITEYINTNLGTNMRPIGVHGNVKILGIHECKFKTSGRTAILFDGDCSKLLKILNQKNIKFNKTFENNKIMLNKINLLSILDSRGLEFETVYVWMPENDKDDMLNNKKYVAYTRALNELTILA